MVIGYINGMEIYYHWFSGKGGPLGGLFRYSTLAVHTILAASLAAICREHHAYIAHVQKAEKVVLRTTSTTSTTTTTSTYITYCPVKCPLSSPSYTTIFERTRM